MFNTKSKTDSSEGTKDSETLKLVTPQNLVVTFAITFVVVFGIFALIISRTYAGSTRAEESIYEKHEEVTVASVVETTSVSVTEPEPEPETPVQEADADLITAAKTATELLSESEILLGNGNDLARVQMIINLMYAFHGKKFRENDEFMRRYGDMLWYTGISEVADVSPAVFNDIEKANFDLLIKLRKRLKNGGN